MGDHEPHNCPNKILIDQLREQFAEFNDKFHDLDKKNAVDNAVLQSQYKTIIDMLTTQADSNVLYSERLAKLEKDFKLNDYKTTQATTFIERITWGVVAKLGTIITLMGAVASYIYKG